MTHFKHIGGDVFWGQECLAPVQIAALAEEFRDFADAAFRASDFPAYERHVATHGGLIEACREANRWASAWVPSNTNGKAA